MCDGSNKRVSVKIEQQLFKASAIIGNCVRTFASGRLVEQQTLDRLR